MDEPICIVYRVAADVYLNPDEAAAEAQLAGVPVHTLAVTTPAEHKVIQASIALVVARNAYNEERIEHGTASPRATVTLGKAEENHANAVNALLGFQRATQAGTALAQPKDTLATTTTNPD